MHSCSAVVVLLVCLLMSTSHAISPRKIVFDFSRDPQNVKATIGTEKLQRILASRHRGAVRTVDQMAEMIAKDDDLVRCLIVMLTCCYGLAHMCMAVPQTHGATAQCITRLIITH